VDNFHLDRSLLEQFAPEPDTFWLGTKLIAQKYGHERKPWPCILERNTAADSENALDNPLWREPRIHAEPRKLGIENGLSNSADASSEPVPEREHIPEQSNWSHRLDGFPCLPTITVKVLFVFVRYDSVSGWPPSPLLMAGSMDSKGRRDNRGRPHLGLSLSRLGRGKPASFCTPFTPFTPEIGRAGRNLLNLDDLIPTP
jgi:hypothetical protein